MTLLDLPGTDASPRPSVLVALRAWHVERSKRRAETNAISRLAALSPHLVDDIGAGPVAPSDPPRPELWVRGGA